MIKDCECPYCHDFLDIEMGDPVEYRHAEIIDIDYSCWCNKCEKPFNYYERYRLQSAEVIE